MPAIQFAASVIIVAARLMLSHAPGKMPSLLKALARRFRPYNPKEL